MTREEFIHNVGLDAIKKMSELKHFMSAYSLYIREIVDNKTFNELYDSLNKTIESIDKNLT